MAEPLQPRPPGSAALCLMCSELDLRGEAGDASGAEVGSVAWGGLQVGLKVGGGGEPDGAGGAEGARGVGHLFLFDG